MSESQTCAQGAGLRKEEAVGEGREKGKWGRGEMEEAGRAPRLQAHGGGGRRKGGPEAARAAGKKQHSWARLLPG